MSLREVVYFHDSKISQPNIPCVSAASTLRCDNGPRAERARLSDREWPRGRGGDVLAGRGGADARSARGQAASAELPARPAPRTGAPAPERQTSRPPRGRGSGDPESGDLGPASAPKAFLPGAASAPLPAPPPTRGSPARAAPPPGMLGGGGARPCGHVTDCGAGRAVT